jgi:hypothetical protein
LANTDGKHFQDSLLEVCRMMTQSAVHTHGSVVSGTVYSKNLSQPDAPWNIKRTAIKWKIPNKK